MGYIVGVIGRDNGRENGNDYFIMGYILGHSTPGVDRIWGIWRSHFHIPKAIFYLLTGSVCQQGFCLGIRVFAN